MTVSGAIERPPAGAAPSLRSGGQDGAAARPDAAAPVRADGVELLGENGGSGYRRPPSLVRRVDGQAVQLTPLLYALLEEIDGRREFDELAVRLGDRIRKHVDPDDVRFLAESKLRPLGLLQQADGTAPTVAAPSPLLALRLKLAVSSPSTTRRLTAPFAWLFQPAVVIAMLVTFTLTVWWIAFEKGLASAAHQMLYRPTLILVVLGLTLLSAAFHELGHAAACRYGGAKPGRMGIGLYLLWPAFYTDVTDSYRLGRGGRLRVDLGGLYFNAIFAVATVGVWTFVHWDALLLVIAAQVLQMVRQLVPFVRFDGYHILADLVGVPDLFHHIKPTLLALLPTRWGRPDGKALKPWVRTIVTLWVLVVVPLLTGFLVLMVVVMPRVVATAWDSLGIQWHELGAGWARADVATIGARLLSMLLIVLPIAGTVYLLVRVGRRIVRSVMRATARRPVARAGVALVALGLVAGLAWAWWPGGGQYRPIGPHERGRIVEATHVAARVARVARVANTLPAAEPKRRRGASPLSSPGPATHPAAGHAAWMLVLLPNRPKRGDEPGASPTVLLPSLPDDSPTLTPPTVAAPDAPTTSAETTDAVAAPPSTVVTVAPPASGQTQSAWPFPFDPPPPPNKGDNQALAVNTTNGSTKYVVALSLVWVTDGGPVDQRNTAYAAASCTGCQTVAVAFQAVFVIGYAQIVTPVNNAVAVNYHCDTCVTGALAIQLEATLGGKPSDAAMKELAAVWAQLQQVSTTFELQPLAEVRAELNATQAQLLDILARDGALSLPTPPTGQTATSETTTDPTSTTETTDAQTTTVQTTDQTTTGNTTTTPTTTAPATSSSTTTAQTSTTPTTTGKTTTAETTITAQPTTTTTQTTTTDPTTTSETTTTTPETTTTTP